MRSVKSDPDIFQNERDDGEKIPERDVPGRSFRFNEIAHTTGRFDSEPFPVDVVDVTGIPGDPVNDVSEIDVTGATTFSFLVVDVDSESKFKREVRTRQGISGIAGMVTPENRAEYFTIVSDGDDMRDVLGLEIGKDVVGIESAVKAENPDSQVKVTDDCEKRFEVFRFGDTAFYRENRKSQPVSGCDNVERDVGVG